jgi:hypothetical protein
MHLKHLLAGLAMACLAQLSVAQALEYKGIPFGTDEARLREAIPELDCPAQIPGRCFVREPRTYAAEAVDSIVLTLIDGKLERFSVTFKPRSFEAIAAALREKYGAPNTVENSDYQTVGGAKSTQTSHLWKFQDGAMMLISRYGSKITSGSLSANSAVALKRGADQLKERETKAKGDI